MLWSSTRCKLTGYLCRRNILSRKGEVALSRYIWCANNCTTCTPRGNRIDTKYRHPNFYKALVLLRPHNAHLSFGHIAWLLPLEFCLKAIFETRDLFIHSKCAPSTFPVPINTAIMEVTYSSCGPVSSVGIATELQAGRSGIESRWGRDFPPVQTGPGPHSSSCKMGTGSFPGVEAAGAWG